MICVVHSHTSAGLIDLHLNCGLVNVLWIPLYRQQVSTNTIDVNLCELGQQCTWSAVSF